VSALRASLIISTWNGRHLLEMCLPSVLRAVERDGGPHEVIVVDDGSTDDTVDFLRHSFPQVRLVALKRNLRFAGANNAAARLAQGDVLVFLNNDMLVEPDFLAPLLRHFSDPSVFAVTARIEMPPRRVRGGLVQETGLVRARFERGLFVLHHEQPASDQAVPVIYAGGGSSAWRRDRFFALGGFDLLFRPFYFEDLDVSYRGQKAGWRVLFEPASRVFHQHRQTNSPRNFPAGYVDLMFDKNSLLFVWKVLTDQGLLAAHFRGLWRSLMHTRAHPRLASAFLRAALQLPELLVKRRRARAGSVLSDHDVLRLAAGTPNPQAADAGDLPYGSTGQGKRILVLGFSPLPFEPELRLCALSHRTWHIAQALLADGHQVTVVGVRMADSYRSPERLPSVLRFRGQHFTYYSAEHAAFEGGELLPRICAQLQPDAIVAVHAYCGWIASRLKTDAALWADLCGYGMAEAQARAAQDDSDQAISEAWRRERATLARADAFSVVSLRQKYATIGELAAIGRLRARNYGQDRVHYLPNAIENLPYRHRQQLLRGRLVGDEDFVILWAGGYNTWTDVDTLFAGLTAAMAEDPRIKFVSLGGALPGRDEKTFYRFRQRAAASAFADRFIFAGWVPNESVPNYYFESDVGINIDRFGYEMLMGDRYRIWDMLRAGLPVITSLGTETSQLVRDERLGLAFAPGDADGLKQAVLTLARDEALRRRCALRGRDYVFRHRLVEQVMAPLRRWAQAPERTADRMELPDEGALGTPLPAGGPRAAARAIIAGLADLASKALVRRRGVEPWGLDPREPPQSLLVIRAGGVSLTRAVVGSIRDAYPAAGITVLTPDTLETETAYETGAPVIPAKGAGAVSYQVSSATLRAVRARRFDTIVIAGEGNRRAELLALLAGPARRVEVRDDGAAHIFWFAPYKPLMMLPVMVADLLGKITLTALIGLIWGSISAEGGLYRLLRARPRAQPSR